MDKKFTLPPPQQSLKVSVAIPVKDEALLLPMTLRALAAQTDPAGRLLDPNCWEVLVLANNCTDNTADVARRFAAQHPGFNLHVLETTLPSSQAHIGFARRLVMDEALHRLCSTAGPLGIIASTDGDTEVASDWLAQIIREIDAGADAVGGFTLPTQFAGPDESLYCERDALYHRLCAQLETQYDPDDADPWPRHHQFFGANMAVTADAYCRAGRLPTVNTLEDIALSHCLRRIDARIRHSPYVRATTSARLCSRVPMGLATQLQEWCDMSQAGLTHYVESPEALRIRFCAHAELRRLWRDSRNTADWNKNSAVRLANTLCVPSALILVGLHNRHDTFGTLWELVLDRQQEPRSAWAVRWPLRPIVEAITRLHQLLGSD